MVAFGAIIGAIGGAVKSKAGQEIIKAGVEAGATKLAEKGQASASNNGGQGGSTNGILTAMLEKLAKLEQENQVLSKALGLDTKTTNT